MMKKLAALFLAILFYGPFQAEALELILINKTDSPLYEVYAVPAEYEEWGYDKLPYDVILPGDHAAVELDLDPDKPVNFKILDEDGDSYYKFNVDISSRRKILISPDDHEVFSSEGLMRFTLVNKTGAVVRALYISSEADEDWGDNLLEGYLMESSEKVLEIQSSGASSFYDIRFELAGESIVKKRIFISDRARVLLTLH